MIFREIRENAEAAVSAASKTALALVRFKKEVGDRLVDIETRLKAIEDSMNDGEIKTLRDEKDYIEGMFNMLNFNVDVAKKAKGRELNE